MKRDNPFSRQVSGSDQMSAGFSSCGGSWGQSSIREMIGPLFLLAHLHDIQLLTGLLESWGIGIFRDLARGKEIEPLVQGHARPLVEVVDLEDVVLRIKLIHLTYLELLLLIRTQPQQVALAHPAEFCFAVVDNVIALPKVKVHDIDGIILTYLKKHPSARSDLPLSGEHPDKTPKTSRAQAIY